MSRSPGKRLRQEEVFLQRQTEAYELKKFARTETAVLRDSYVFRLIDYW